MRHLILIAGALALTACATTQDERASERADDTTVANAEGEELICQRVGGSRLPGQRVCRTQAEWDRTRSDGQDVLRDMQRQPQQSPF